MTITLINDTKKLSSMIASIKRRSATFNHDIHVVAYNAICHAENTGDVRLIQRLYDAVSGPATKDAIRKWVVLFGKVRFDTKKGIFKFAKTGESDLRLAALEGPMSYMKPKAQPVRKEFDLVKELNTLILKAKKAGVDTTKLVKTREQYAS